MKIKSLFFSVVVLILSFTPSLLLANHCGELNPCSEYLVKFSPSTSLETIGALLRREDLLILDHFGRTQIYHLVGDPDGSREEVIRRLNADPSVVYAEPNPTIEVQRTPNDPMFLEQWALRNTGQVGGVAGADLGMAEVWEDVLGSPQMIVAVIDSGIDYLHEDLVSNMWVNPREVPGNHTDDDGNGLIDDIYGYNFLDENGDPKDYEYHGTHVAGIIGAKGNNGIGITGISWNVKLMAIKITGNSGTGSLSDIIRAIDYAVDHGAKVINMSWGFSSSLTGLPTNPALEPNQALRNALVAADESGVIVIAAAGNYTTNIDQRPFYPAAYSVGNLISVAATTPSDTLATFSNYGATAVDLGAPGQTIVSTYPGYLGRLYSYASGTSMAAPHVAGAAALLWSAFPSLSHRQVIEKILQGVRPNPSLAGKTATGGRLDIERAFALNPQAPTSPQAPSTPTDPSRSIPGSAGPMERIPSEVSVAEDQSPTENAGCSLAARDPGPKNGRGNLRNCGGFLMFLFLVSFRFLERRCLSPKKRIVRFTHS